MATALKSYNVAPNPNDALHTILPIGAVVIWTTLNAPSQWLLCDGSPVSRVVYAALFDVIGTTYGPGDGSVTFNLPNMTQRVVRGVFRDVYPLAGTGGADNVTLIPQNLPDHGHELIDPGHTHQQAQGGQEAAPGSTWRAGDPNTGGPNVSTSVTDITVKDSVLVAGVQVTQEVVDIRDPYIALNYIIKAA